METEKKPSRVREFLKKITPLRIVVRKVRELSDTGRWHLQSKWYTEVLLPRNLKRLQGKSVVNVAFVAWNLPMWKLHSLYTLLEEDAHFHPFVILTPSPGKNQETRQHDLVAMQQEFAERGYRVYPKVQWENLNFDADLRETIDILFVTQPYEPQGLKFGIGRYVLCYSAYGFSTTAVFAWSENSFLKNSFWHEFVASPKTIEDAAKITFNHAKNRVYTGYPLGDELLHPQGIRDPWNDTGKRKKRIIWAPHFSVNPEHCFVISNFLRLYDVMFAIAEEFKDDVQFAFKPHPFLFDTMCQEQFWGVKRTEAYYEKWRNLENGQLETGAYVGLFAHSDAIIHDCGSFTIEYLYTQKPAMYLMKRDGVRDADSLGKEALDCYYHGTEADEIRAFIRDVVLGGQDTMKEKRRAFYEKYLMPPHGKSAAQNILDELKKGLNFD